MVDVRRVGAALLAIFLAVGCSTGGSETRNHPTGAPACTPASQKIIENLNAGAEDGATITTAFVEDGGPYDPGFGEGYTSFSYVAANVKDDVAVWAVTYQGTEIAVTLPANDHARAINITGRDASPGAPIYAGINGPSDEAYPRAVACAAAG